MQVILTDILDPGGVAEGDAVALGVQRGGIEGLDIGQGDAGFRKGRGARAAADAQRGQTGGERGNRPGE